MWANVDASLYKPGTTKCLFGQDAAEGECQESCSDPPNNDCRCLSKAEVQERWRDKKDNFTLAGAICLGCGLLFVPIAAYFSYTGRACEEDPSKTCFARIVHIVFVVFPTYIFPFAAVPGVIFLVWASTIDMENYDAASYYHISCGTEGSAGFGTAMSPLSALYLIFVYYV